MAPPGRRSRSSSATSRRWRSRPRPARAFQPIALGNFTWDWIYAGYRTSCAAGGTLVANIREAYRQAALALRLPMAGGFDMFRERRRSSLHRAALAPAAVARRRGT